MNQTTGAPRFHRLSARELRFAEKPAIDPSDGRRDRTEKRAASADRPARSDRLLRVIGGDSFAHRSYHALPKTIRRSDGKGRARSLASRTWPRLRSAPRSRSCATMTAARPSGSFARIRRIPAADRSPMCPYLPTTYRKWVGEAVEMDRREIEIVAVEQRGG